MRTEDAADVFLKRLQEEAASFNKLISTEDDQWIAKGFIDVFKRVYTISGDTKVISKVLEIMLFPCFSAFAERYGYEIVIAGEQNHYPDISFVDEKHGYKFAVDLKTTYRIGGKGKVSRMTLGAFTGYFRNRGSRKNCTFPYEEYSGHFVLGAVYSRSTATKVEDQLKIYGIEDLAKIPSVIKDIQFFAQPKYRIAIDKPGSGNTKNMGSVDCIDELMNGKGPFAELGESVFKDYWIYYLTADMARAVELPGPPYNNLKAYFEYKGMPRDGAAPPKGTKKPAKRPKDMCVVEDSESEVS